MAEARVSDCGWSCGQCDRQEPDSARTCAAVMKSYYLIEVEWEAIGEFLAVE